MTGADIYEVLASKGIRKIFHSNSATTGATFFKLGGLASRSFVEINGFPQTPQYTDDLDKTFGIWNDVFFDTVDIHKRVSNINKYGPVLFVFDARVLLDLPAGSEIFVTKTNPSKWRTGGADSDKFLLGKKMLCDNLVRGTFDQMIIVRTEKGFIPFSDHLIEIVLDDPGVNGTLDSVLHVIEKNGLIEKTNIRKCGFGCKCKATYANSARARGLFNV